MLLAHRLNSRGYVLGNGQGQSDHEAIRMPSMHIARTGSTGGTQEYPMGHREVRIDVNRLVTSVSTAQWFTYIIIEFSDVHAAGFCLDRTLQWMTLRGPSSEGLQFAGLHPYTSLR